MNDTFTKTFLYKSPITGTEFWSYDDDTDIDELDFFDMLDEEEELQMKDKEIELAIEAFANQEELDCLFYNGKSLNHWFRIFENYIQRLKSSDANKENYTIELYNRAKEAEREAREWKQRLIILLKIMTMK